jgi:hypothetical protein
VGGEIGQVSARREGDYVIQVGVKYPGLPGKKPKKTSMTEDYGREWNSERGNDLFKRRDTNSQEKRHIC